MKKLDFKKTLKEFYAPSRGEAVVVDVPAARFLMVDGHGDPNTSRDYTEAVEALFSVSYGVKFAVKKSALTIDYGVMPLEGLWWADDMATFSVENKAAWNWTMMIRQPDFVTSTMIEVAVTETKRKKDLPGLARVRWEKFAEGPSAQILHIGPFAEEGPALEKVHALVASLGGELSGKHHEIYLTDIRRAAPKTWKTVLRQPFR